MIRLAMLAMLALTPGCAMDLFEPDTEVGGDVDNRLVAYLLSEGQLKPTHDMGNSTFHYRSGKDQNVTLQRDDAWDPETGNQTQGFLDVGVGAKIGEFQRDIRGRDNERIESGYAAGANLTLGIVSAVRDLAAAGATGGLLGGGGGGGGSDLAALLPLLQGARGSDGAIDPAVLSAVVGMLSPPPAPEPTGPSAEDVQAMIDAAVASALANAAAAGAVDGGDDAGDVP